MSGWADMFWQFEFEIGKWYKLLQAKHSKSHSEKGRATLMIDGGREERWIDVLPCVLLHRTQNLQWLIILWGFSIDFLFFKPALIWRKWYVSLVCWHRNTFGCLKGRVSPFVCNQRTVSTIFVSLHQSRKTTSFVVEDLNYCVSF